MVVKGLKIKVGGYFVIEKISNSTLYDVNYHQDKPTCWWVAQRLTKTKAKALCDHLNYFLTQDAFKVEVEDLKAA